MYQIHRGFKVFHFLLPFLFSHTPTVDGFMFEKKWKEIYIYIYIFFKKSMNEPPHDGLLVLYKKKTNTGVGKPES